MRLLVQIEAFETIRGTEADRRLREAVGAGAQALLQSGKVREAGFLTDRRGAFFLLEIEMAEELYALFGPEVYSNFRMEVSPVAPMEKISALFAEWAQAGR